MYHFSPVFDAFGFFSQTVDMRDELTLQDDLIFKANPVVIPRSLHADMKARIHSSHPGTESCLRRACECIYWPGMSAEIKQYISACEICRELDTTSQPNEPLMSHEVPSCPWERVGTHIFFLDGKEYLITIDYCSNFWEVDRLLDNNAKYGSTKAEESLRPLWNTRPSNEGQWPTIRIDRVCHICENL